MFDFLVAFLAAALAGMGVGGGGLYIIYLTLIKNVPQLEAQGVNLAFFIVGALSAILLHLSKRNVRIPLVLLVGAFGAVGAFAGSHLAAHLPTEILSKCFGAFLTLCGFRSFFAKNQK